jgi:hypothetical protein
VAIKENKSKILYHGIIHQMVIAAIKKSYQVLDFSVIPQHPITKRWP